jgi:hypothetical protein
MIFDRKQSDVDDSLEIISEKVKKNIELSADDLATLEKGTITASTLNRIENKERELQDRLCEMYYFSPIFSSKNWEMGDIFKENEFQRIIENLHALRDSFFLYRMTPSELGISYDFENLNNIERNLYDLERMSDFVLANYKECGTFESGG